MKSSTVRGLLWAPLAVGVVIFVSQFFVERNVPLMMGVACEDEYGYVDDGYDSNFSYGQGAVADCIGEVDYIMRGFPSPFSECTEQYRNSADVCAPYDDAALIVMGNAAVLIAPGLIIGAMYEGVRHYRKNHRT